MDGESLGSLWRRTVIAHAALDRRYDGGAHASCLALWRECSRRVDALALFSAHEHAEDLQTSAMPYMLVDYVGASVLAMAREERASALGEAHVLLSSFLARVRAYGLLDADAAALAGAVPNDAGEARSFRIARMRYAGPFAWSEPDTSADDDAARAHWTSVLRRAVVRAAMDLESLRDEQRLLSARSRPEAVARTAPPPLRPFVLLPSAARDRAAVAGGVFRPGHSLPTMTIDEYLAIERARGGIVPRAAPRTEPDSDDDAVADARTAEDRRFDAFKDDTPFGSGNTFNLS